MWGDKESKQEQHSYNLKTETPQSAAITVTATSKTKRPWTPQEDEALIALVQKYGPKDWMSICINLPSRNRKQCRDRFMNHLNKKVKKGSWTQEEDDLIFEWQERVGNKWSIIARYLPHRSENAIKNRYWSALRSKQRRAIKEARKKERQKENDDVFRRCKKKEKANEEQHPPKEGDVGNDMISLKCAFQTMIPDSHFTEKEKKEFVDSS